MIIRAAGTRTGDIREIQQGDVAVTPFNVVDLASGIGEPNGGLTIAHVVEEPDVPA